jgi:uncharacterized protein (TIGR02265 family)
MPAMNGTSRALELVADHCDLVDRLRALPPSAAVHGLYHQHVEKTLYQCGRLEVYRAYFPSPVSALRHFALGDYLLRLATAGALVAGPEKLHEGMREITRGHAAAFAQSLLGRALFRLLANDPRKLIEQGVAARRLTHRYGRWSLIQHGPRTVEVVYEDEFAWIDSAVAGAAEGTFAGLDFPVHQRHTQRSRFSGSTIHSW